MLRLVQLQLLSLVLVFSPLGYPRELDAFLHELLDNREPTLLDNASPPIDPVFILGRALFYDPLLSGNRDISCASCHRLEYGTGDGKAFPFVNKFNKHFANCFKKRKVNTLDLWNRGHPTFVRGFRDGRLTYSKSFASGLPSPLTGMRVPPGITNLLELQVIVPLLTPCEMLGHPGDYSTKTIPDEHSLKLNELSWIAGVDPAENGLLVLDALTERLTGGHHSKKSATQKHYSVFFSDAYPDVRLEEISISEIARALAYYVKHAFKTSPSDWDRYRMGDEDAINIIAKEGAILFFGKSRCYVCHSGPLFSDFQVYELVNQGKLIKLRTSPLRNVAITAPYLHDGRAKHMTAALRQHPTYPSVSKAKMPYTSYTSREYAALVEFLESLTSPGLLLSRSYRAPPKDLPSHLR